MKSGLAGVPSLEQWIVQNTPSHANVGIHAGVVSKHDADGYAKYFKAAGSSQTPCIASLIY